MHHDLCKTADMLDSAASLLEIKNNSGLLGRGRGEYPRGTSRGELMLNHLLFRRHGLSDQQPVGSTAANEADAYHKNLHL